MRMTVQLKSPEKQWQPFKLLIVVMDMLWRTWGALVYTQNTYNEAKLGQKKNQSEIRGKAKGHVAYVRRGPTLHQILNKQR